MHTGSPSPLTSSSTGLALISLRSSVRIIHSSFRRSNLFATAPVLRFSLLQHSSSPLLRALQRAPSARLKVTRKAATARDDHPARRQLRVRPHDIEQSEKGQQTSALSCCCEFCTRSCSPANLARPICRRLLRPPHPACAAFHAVVLSSSCGKPGVKGGGWGGGTDREGKVAKSRLQ